MQSKTTKYMVVETTGSFIVNGILNFLSAYAIFHGRSLVPATGRNSLLLDSIGETFIVTFLSYLVPSLIARQRRRAGTLPMFEHVPPKLAGNPYIRALVTGVVFTCVLTACNAILLPRLFPDDVSFENAVLFKTLYGAVVGALASWLAIHKALSEVEVLSNET